jgi:hypothetical protein
MLDLPDQPVLNKDMLVGGCARLPLRLDAQRLLGEVQAIPQGLWGTTGPRIGVHDAADALFLRGYLPAEGDKPIEERPALALLPYVRTIISELIPATPLRCLLARLPAGATIIPHIDRAPYFAKTLRIHVPVITHDRVWMQCAGKSYVMKPGEAWALNNSAVHAAWNQHDTQARIHLICDFIPSPTLLALLARSERNLGVEDAHVKAHFIAAAQAQASKTS